MVNILLYILDLKALKCNDNSSDHQVPAKSSQSGNLTLVFDCLLEDLGCTEGREIWDHSSYHFVICC